MPVSRNSVRWQDGVMGAVFVLVGRGSTHHALATTRTAVSGLVFGEGCPSRAGA